MHRFPLINAGLAQVKVRWLSTCVASKNLHRGPPSMPQMRKLRSEVARFWLNAQDTRRGCQSLAVFCSDRCSGVSSPPHVAAQVLLERRCWQVSLTSLALQIPARPPETSRLPSSGAIAFVTACSALVPLTILSPLFLDFKGQFTCCAGHTCRTVCSCPTHPSRCWRHRNRTPISVSPASGCFARATRMITPVSSTDECLVLQKCDFVQLRSRVQPPTSRSRQMTQKRTR